MHGCVCHSLPQTVTLSSAAWAINLPNSYRRRINTMATDTVSQWSPANNVRREQLYISVRDDE